MSRDGVERITVRVDHRMCREDVVWALAIELVEAESVAPDLEAAARSYSRTAVLRVLRDRIRNDGEDHWPEYDHEDYATAWTASERRIAELWTA